MSINNFWPLKESSPRQSQQEILDWMEKQPSHIKYFLVEAPTGTGKSPIGLNLSGYLSNSSGNSYILTPQKILQKQYEDSFRKELINSLYGKSNYICKTKHTNCDVGMDINPRCESCPYLNARSSAFNSYNLVLSYSLGLILFSMSKEFKTPVRKLMVLDECHTFEHHLTEHRAVQISERKCKQLKITYKTPYDESDAYDFLINRYIPALSSHIITLTSMVEDIEDKIQNGIIIDKDDISIINRCREYIEHEKKINSLVRDKEFLFNNFVLIKDKTYFKFKELYGRNVFTSTVKPMAEKFLFMSSTILNKDEYCKDIGLNPNETSFISVNSEFDPKNRPTIFIPTTKMAYGWDKEENKNERQKMLKSIAEICTDHSGENGIIHTGSFQVANWLVTELDKLIPHKILHHNPDSDGSTTNRDHVINEFIQNDPYRKILISPSITEGLDLKEDIARFAIVAKVPYPYMGDAWVKRRMTISNEWYRRQAMIGIIQGSGRICRTTTDWGVTYILDTSFSGLYKYTNKDTPKWWKSAYTEW